MFKRARAWISVVAVITLIGLHTVPVKAVQGNDSFVTGIFIAPELTSVITQAEWNESLLDMRAIGIDTVIVQYSFQTDSVYGNQSYFPYWQPDTVGDASQYPLRRSQIGYILSAAQNAGIDVYLGLQIAERDWFDLNLYQDYDKLYSQYWLSYDLANALWDAFGSTYGDIIAGWYLPFEFESTSEYYSYFTQLASVYYGPVTTALKNDSRFGNKSIMISPLMYSADDKVAWQNNLKTILSNSQIDIVAPQDGIGFGTQTHATVGAWFQATKQAVDDVNQTYSKAICLWGNCENYARLRNPNETDAVERIKPMAIRKFIASLDIVAPYVDNLVTFSIHRWDKVFANNEDLGVNISYYEAYKRYYTTGTLPACISDGYYVAITPAAGYSLTFNAYANAGLTDGFATTVGDWSQYKGIHSPFNQPFVLEIRFDDPSYIKTVKSNFYKDLNAAIAWPSQIQYEYFVRSGSNDEIFTYTTIQYNYPSGQESSYFSTVELSSPVMADGIRITVTPNGEWTFIDDIWIES